MLMTILIILAGFSPIILVVLIGAKIESVKKREPAYLMSIVMILLTKWGKIKWKKRMMIENLIFETEPKYKTKIGKKEYRIVKTTLIFPEQCYIDVYKNGVFKRRYSKVYRLLKFLKENDKYSVEYLPKDVMNDPSRWIKGKEHIARRIKLNRILN